MRQKKNGRSQPGNARTAAPGKPPGWHRFRWIALVALVLGVCAIGYDWLSTSRARVVLAPTTPIAAPATSAQAGARFVGAKACADCHAEESAKWQRSQHALAMQHATDATVLGNFNDASFDYHGTVSRFFRRDGKFFVNTDGPEGKLADFEISYTFGVYPLQQYLVAFADGRMQALPIAWDARTKEQGGARWYHLYPDEHVTSRDPLHWTGLNQNWNWMCADCHSTKLDRNYEPANNTYATRWAEINVACEACHGPGSQHVAWANGKRGKGRSEKGSESEKGAESISGSASLPLATVLRPEIDSDPFSAPFSLVVALDERKGVTWQPDTATGNAVRSRSLTSKRELGVCAQCHSRRAPFAAGMKHDGRFFETHELSLLDDKLYFADGQQHDEVYDIGSFLQSKMHARGVTCSDCHDPHSGQLRATGNAVCAQCHAAQKYDAATHTLHKAGSTGAQCAACHMPTRNYMVIDARHDHSIRVPRPDLDAQLGTPDACTSCHADRKPAWAAATIERAFGPVRKGFQAFGPTLHDAHAGAPGATPKLIALAQDAHSPAIVRASAVAALRGYLSATSLPAIEAALADLDAMVRGAALDVLLSVPPVERVRLGVGLIDDPSRIVRIKAGRVLAIAQNEGMAPEIHARLDKVFAEYVESQRANSDRPEALMNLGLFYLDRHDPLQSEASYKAALALQPDFIPAIVNLADLYRSYQRENDAEAVLRAALERSPRNADLLHALGLLRVRAGQMPAALPLLAAAMRADPANVHYAYVNAIALHDGGHAKESIAVLEQALQRAPTDRDLLEALSSYSRELGDSPGADRYARRLAQLQAADTPLPAQPGIKID